MRCDLHCPTPGSSIPGPLAVLWFLARALYQLARVGGLGLVVFVVLAYRWFSGAPMRPTWSGRRLVTRPVRATGQTLVTVLAVAAALNWQITVAFVAGVAAFLTTTAVVTRRRVRRQVRVRLARVGRVDQAVTLPAALAASTGADHSLWSASILRATMVNQRGGR